MSTEKLEEYKALYSEYIKELVNVHNYHNTFIVFRGKSSGEAVRNSLRKIINIEKQLWKLSREAYLERLEEIKDQTEKFRELRKQYDRPMPIRKGRPKPEGPPKPKRKKGRPRKNE